MPARRSSCVAALIALLLSASTAFGQSHGGPRAKIDRALADALASGARSQRVIISVQPGLRDAVRDALRQHGDVVTAEHPSVDAIAAVVHAEDIAELANNAGVAYVSIDATVYAGANSRRRQGFRNVTSASSAGSRSRGALRSTLRETLGLPARPTWTTPTGAGVTIALVDSGIDPRNGLGRRITAFYDFTRGGIPTLPYDDFGHGTHIAGLIGAAAGPFTGVAPEVNFVGLKVLDKDGQGSTSDVIKAIEFVTTNRQLLGVDIINLSLGHPIYAPADADPLVAAVERASAAGIIVVASAGNFGVSQRNAQPGYTGVTSPGNAPSAITVGATDTKNTTERTDDVVAPYSSRGPTWFDGYAKPDVVAPGHKLVSEGFSDQTLLNLLPLNVVFGSHGKEYLQLSGTSMAAGVASGVVSLLVESHKRAGYTRALTPNLVKAMLEFSAIPVGGADPLTQGAGEINADGAIALAGAIDTSAAPGTWWLRTGVQPFSTIGHAQYEWSQRIIWGDRILTGELLYHNDSAWTTGVAWGQNIVWGLRTYAQMLEDNIVWGTSAVWGRNLVWADRLIGQAAEAGDNIVWGMLDGGDNIVWGTLDADNIVWGMVVGDDVVFGTFEGDNIVWGMVDGDNIVWGLSLDFDNIVWGMSSSLDNIVWGLGLTGRARGQ